MNGHLRFDSENLSASAEPSHFDLGFNDVVLGNTRFP